MPAISGDQFWFTAQVIPRHEKNVDRILEHKGYEHFLPTHKMRKKWSDRIKILDEPLFPGYVFFRARQSLAGSVLSSPGIIRIISFGGKPYAVPDEEIDALQRIVHAQREVYSFPFLNVGRKVEVVKGPLFGITGIITQVRKRDRLIVSVDLIMKSASVEIDASEVAPVPGATAALAA